MLRMINAQGGAKCEKLISDQGGKSVIRVGQKFKMCKHVRAFYLILESRTFLNHANVLLFFDQRVNLHLLQYKDEVLNS